jgi:hypothetical protein
VIGIAALVILALAAGFAGIALIRAGILFPQKPTTVALDIRDGQTEVPLDRSLKFTFTRPVAPPTVASSIRIQPAGEGSLAISADDRHFTWVPSTPWADLTPYTVTLAALKDSAGHPVAAHRWHFTTTIVPRVLGLGTDSGTVSEGAELPLATTLKLAFNAAMDAATVKVLVNSTVAAGLTWSPDGKLAILPTTAVPAGPVEVAVPAGGKDQLGHKMVAGWTAHLTLVFTTSLHTVALQAPALLQVPNDNYGARDQSGLQAASIAFEYVVEGGITRMSALFTSIPDNVGPIRSGRPISFQLTRHYHGINLFSGLSSVSTAYLNAGPVPTLSDTAGIFYRSTARAAPDNLYVSGPAFQSYQGGDGQPAFALPTSSPALLTGGDGASATVSEHNSTYAFDPLTGTYLKTEDGHLMADALLGQPLHIQLLVVMHTIETVSNVVDVEGTHGRNFDTESGGAAEFYYLGKKATGHWSSTTNATPFAFLLDGGGVLTLPKGLVWIDIVGN